MIKKWVLAALSIAGYKLVPANRFKSFSEKGFFDELYSISNNKKIMLIIKPPYTLNAIAIDIKINSTPNYIGFLE